MEELIRAREAAGDRILSGLGIGLAISSIAFAAYAIVTNPGRSDTPMALLSGAGGIPVRKILAADAPAEEGMDPATTGSLSTGDGKDDTARDIKLDSLAERTNPKSSGRGYVVRGGLRGSALVEGPAGLLQVVPGAVLPGAGRVMSIERSETGWVVVTSETVISSPQL